MFVTPSLFDDWSLIKAWGRVGSPGTVRKEWLETQEEALVVRNKSCAAKCKKGYQAIGVYVTARDHKSQEPH